MSPSKTNVEMIAGLSGDAALSIGESGARRWAIGLLALIVVIMTVAVGTVLAFTMQQANELSKPQAYADLWYLYSIDSELLRLRSTAENLLAGKASASDLSDRIQIVLSIVAPNESAPSSETPVIDEMPDVRADLESVPATLRRWNAVNVADDTSRADGLAREIQEQEPHLHDVVERCLGLVHVETLNRFDVRRSRLHRNFVVLAWVMAGLLVGMVLLLARLVYDYRQAMHRSKQLADLNTVLEQQVEVRTREIVEGKELLNFILESSPSDVVLAGAKDGKVFFINSQFRKRLGLQDGIKSIDLQGIFQSREEGQRFLEEINHYGALDDWEAVLSHIDPFWSTISARRLKVSGTPAQLLWSYDISARKQLEEQLRELATTDELTGLGNRREFMARGETLLAHCIRQHHDCTVMMADLDHFKQINDEHGHHMGDMVLKMFAKIFRKELRNFDLTGRLGGEEFAAILPETTLEKAMEVAERVRKATARFEVPILSGGVLSVTISLGLSTLKAGENASLDSLLRQADQALYEAKRSGRNTVMSSSGTRGMQGNWQPGGPA
jgi:diguanylate cyclase (GGDEF)-like protein